jgi:hypothetical protein
MGKQEISKLLTYLTNVEVRLIEKLEINAGNRLVENILKI